MHELSLYDVESAFILVPNYNNKYKKWSGQYLSSSKCMDQAIRRKVPLCTNPKDPGEVATAYKRGYDEAYENLAKAGKKYALRQSSQLMSTHLDTQRSAKRESAREESTWRNIRIARMMSALSYVSLMIALVNVSMT